MTTVPSLLTAYQGFDALFHSTEGYINVTASPISDMLALKSIELIGKYLPIAVKNGSDIEAREKVALANTLSGMVETLSGCTSEHSLGTRFKRFPSRTYTWSRSDNGERGLLHIFRHTRGVRPSVWWIWQKHWERSTQRSQWIL